MKNRLNPLRTAPVPRGGSLLRLLLVLCAALLGPTAGTAPASASEVPNHPLLGTITAERISPLDRFKDACGVAVDSHGDVYVSDYYNDRIAVFDKEGKFITQLLHVDPPPAGGNPLDGPCDLAVDSAGRLYVDNFHRSVVRFTPTEYPPTASTAYGSEALIDSGHPTGVAVDPASDDVYVDDRTYVAVYEAPLSPGDEPALEVGLDPLADYYGVAVSGFEGDAQYAATKGDVYVADAATETVKVYDPALDPANPASVIEGVGTEQGRFHLADTDLAVDPEDGHLYVADNLQPHFEHPEAAIDEFSAAGRYRGAVPPSFLGGSPSFLVDAEPTSAAIGAGGRLYVTSGNGDGPTDSATVYIFGPPAPALTRVLTVAKSGTGEGTIASIPAAIYCGTVCEGEFNQGSTVVLEATPSSGSALAGWSGCDSEPNAHECAVTMGADRSVGAEFEPVAAPLPAPAEPNGTAAGATTLGSPAPGTPFTAGLSASASEIVQRGNLRIAVAGKLSPKALPRKGTAPISVSIGGRITTTDSAAPPQLRTISIAVNRNAHFDYAGLPSCTLREIQPATNRGALAACGRSLVGEGSFSANVALPQQAPFPSQGKVLAFNGRLHGRPAILAHVYGTDPIPTSYTLPFAINPTKGTYGTLLTASLPRVTGEWGYVTGLNLRLDRRFTYRRRRRGYINAGCPAPAGFQGAVFALARTSFAFAGGRKLTATLGSECRAR